MSNKQSDLKTDNFIFQGIKSTWARFENKVKGYIQDDTKHGGTKAVRFLFNDEWNNTEWTIRDVPDPFNNENDPDYRNKYRDTNDKIDRAEKHNEKINKVETLCMAAMRTYCSEPLQRALLRFNGDPIQSVGNIWPTL